MKKYYLAYGSNLNIAQMKFRCEDATVVGTTILKNYRLVYKGNSNNHAYLTIEKKKGSHVPLGIYKVTSFDELSLDIYEGYPILYQKKYVKVNINGKNREAFIYVMNDEFDYHIPSKEYVNTCLEGYQDFGFDPTLLNEAYLFSKENAPKTIKKSR